VQSSEVFEMADEQGISKRTMENAKKELGIRAKKINNSWYWELSGIRANLGKNATMQSIRNLRS
jgi:hypothetical protein